MKKIFFILTLLAFMCVNKSSFASNTNLLTLQVTNKMLVSRDATSIVAKPVNPIVFRILAQVFIFVARTVVSEIIRREIADALFNDKKYQENYQLANGYKFNEQEQRIEPQYGRNHNNYGSLEDAKREAYKNCSCYCPLPKSQNKYKG